MHAHQSTATSFKESKPRIHSFLRLAWAALYMSTIRFSKPEPINQRNLQQPEIGYTTRIMHLEGQECIPIAWVIPILVMIFHPIIFFSYLALRVIRR